MLVEQLIARDGMACTWCCKPMVQQPIHPHEDCNHHMTVEHLIPLILGGTNDLINLALACYACNNRRGANVGWVCEIA